MRIIVNGESKETSCTTVEDLLRELSVDPTKIVVEQNGTILYKEQFATTALAENATFEIVQFVGGG